MTKIIFIKDGFYGIKKGDEFDVDEFRRISISYTAGNHTYTVMCLNVFEGFYEEVIDMPKEGDIFWYVCSDGCVIGLEFRDNSVGHDNKIKYQGWHKTREEAESYRDYCMAYKEE